MPTQFFAMITAEGLAALAAAISGSTQLNFLDIKVGDGSGSYHNPGGNIAHFTSNGAGGTTVTDSGNDLANGEIIDISGTTHYDSLPGHYTVINANPGVSFDIAVAFTSDDATGQWNRTTLVNQVYPVSGIGGPINAVYVHPDHNNWVVIEGYIPAAEGGFTVREVGVGIAGDILFAVGMVPQAEKPIISQGSAADLYFRIILVTSNIANIALVVDPNVILASQTYVQLFAKWASETGRLITGVLFDGSVNQGDAVYFNSATGKFEQAIADGTIKQKSEGFADVIHCCVIRGGYFPWPNSDLTSGSIYYLSTTTLGGIQITPPTRYTVQMGVALATNVMDVFVDKILSAYEDLAFTFDTVGNVGLLHSLNVAVNINAGNNITAGALVQAPNINALSQLGVGSEGGFPAFLVSNAGDIIITGGVDSIWDMIHNGVEVIRIEASHEIGLYMGGTIRRGSATSLGGAIVIGNNSGKIDPGWLPSAPVTSVFPNAYPAPWGAMTPDAGYINVNSNYPVFSWNEIFADDGGGLPTAQQTGLIVDYLVVQAAFAISYSTSLDSNSSGISFRLHCYDVQHGTHTYSTDTSPPYTSTGNVQFTLSMTLPISNHIRLSIQNYCASGFWVYGFRKDVTPGHTPIYWGYDLP